MTFEVAATSTLGQAPALVKTKKDWFFWLVTSFLVAIAVLCAVLPVVLGLDPYATAPSDRLQPPSGVHIMGTDTLGRDLFSRVLTGGWNSLQVGLISALSATLLGCVMGLYSAYYSTLGAILMRIADGLMSFPTILLGIAIVAALGGNKFNIVIALTVVFAPAVARVVRASALVVKEQTYIDALRTMGASSWRIIWGNTLRAVLSPIFVQATYIFAEALIIEAALSFVGAGIPLPEPSWGNILQEAKSVIYIAWWMIAFPGIGIAFTVVSVNIFGDLLRDRLDPLRKEKGV